MPSGIRVETQIKRKPSMEDTYHTLTGRVDMHQCSRTTSNIYDQISKNHIGMTSVTVALCIKTLFQLSERPGRMLKTTEREQGRILGDPLLPSYSPCLEAYSEVSWQTKISLFLYNTLFFFLRIEDAK